MTAERELVVLLDEAGRAVGTAPKSQVHHRDTPLHLAFSCYLFDDQDRLLVTRRADGKRTWPGVWTNTCCGHPAPGESLTAAVRRRVRQELGLEVEDLRLALPSFRYRAVMADGTVENEMCPVVLGRCADPARLATDEDEVGAVDWVEWASFRTEVLAGRRAVSPWCAQQVAALPADPWDAVPPAGTAAAELPVAVRL